MLSFRNPYFILEFSKSYIRRYATSETSIVSRSDVTLLTRNYAGLYDKYIRLPSAYHIVGDECLAAGTSALDSEKSCSSQLPVLHIRTRQAILQIYEQVCY
jgi:hypothetical protein